MAQHYEAAGVNLEAGYEVVSRIKSHVRSTQRLGSMGSIGSFGGMFDLSALGIKEPVLVSGTDGVGTKLKIAFAMDKHDTIGIDAVAMCVNDVLAQGAEPLIFLDYVAVGHNIPAQVEAIVSGVAEGCRQAGCALVGGETAEMPGMYPNGEYDIAGYTTGVVEKSKLIDGTKVKVGDVLIGIASSGVYDLTVQCHYPVAIGKFSRHFRGVVHIVGDDYPADYALHNPAEVVLAFHERARDGNEALARRKPERRRIGFRALHRVNRVEGRSARISFL